VFYFNLGLKEEALEVLELTPPSPMAEYWLAYLWRERNGTESRRHLEKAEAASPELVFPHRREDIPVLRWAAADASGWKTLYYLGLVLWNTGLKDEAGDMFSRLADRPDWAPFYLTRARFLESEGERQTILSDIEKALRLDKKSWRAWRAQTGFFEKDGDYRSAL
jgi:tetratricopeptide (TPR) repeat protein